MNEEQRRRNRLRVAAMLDQVDVHDLVVTVEEAAIYANATEQQIRDWKRRGHLKAADHVGPRRRPVFRALDVLHARTRAEDNLARTQADNLAPTRESVTA